MSFTFIFFLTLLEPSIRSCRPSRENGLDIDAHWSIHAVPPSYYTEAQTLVAAAETLSITVASIQAFSF